MLVLLVCACLVDGVFARRCYCCYVCIFYGVVAMVGMIVIVGDLVVMFALGVIVVLGVVLIRCVLVLVLLEWL